MNQHIKNQTSQIETAIANERQELNLVSIFNLVPFKDGNLWCFLLGPNIQEGVTGFGCSPHKAAIDFNHNWYKKIL